MNNTIELTEEEKDEIYEDSWADCILSFKVINELLTDRYNKWKKEWRKLIFWDIKDWVKITISNPTNSDILKALWKI